MQVVHPGNRPELRGVHKARNHENYDRKTEGGHQHVHPDFQERHVIRTAVPQSTASGHLNSDSATVLSRLNCRLIAMIVLQRDANQNVCQITVPTTTAITAKKPIVLHCVRSDRCLERIEVHLDGGQCSGEWSRSRL